MKAVEPMLNDEQHREVTRLLCELIGLRHNATPAHAGAGTTEDGISRLSRLSASDDFRKFALRRVDADFSSSALCCEEPHTKFV